MELSSRSRYGLKAIVRLAMAYEDGPLQIKIIADDSNIPHKYLEQLFSMMRSAGLVLSVRGPNGGQILTRPPNKITLYEIITSLDGLFIAPECPEHHVYSPRCSGCVSSKVWLKVRNVIAEILKSRTLQDIVDEITSG